MKSQLGDSWPKLADQLAEDRFDRLSNFLGGQRRNWKAHPCEKNVFKAFRETRFRDVKVVILGQDPYPDARYAMGLAFSVPDGVRPLPLSLRNIDHELQTDLRVPPAYSGDLTPWAHAGVFLLNRALTVGEDRKSHLAKWRAFTDEVIKLLIGHENELVFMLWGSKARVVRPRIKNSGRHLVICGAHPVAPGFFKQKYFSQADAFLASHGGRSIRWSRLRAGAKPG